MQYASNMAKQVHNGDVIACHMHWNAIKVHPKQAYMNSLRTATTFSNTWPLRVTLIGSVSDTWFACMEKWAGENDSNVLQTYTQTSRKLKTTMRNRMKTVAMAARSAVLRLQPHNWKHHVTKPRIHRQGTQMTARHSNSTRRAVIFHYGYQGFSNS